MVTMGKEQREKNNLNTISKRVIVLFGDLSYKFYRGVLKNV
jgi:hypothetical protein